ncbi:immediate early response gene 5-like protein [Hemiscyllium ocellatum]|uniref:immediate early response gene 5-like protein n=1 Tax=Hemiscyllium ocellatum TaxID=170820 RepID=UPI0029670CDB|nr:immediate early response gene 5-like protein [Hemiscyllium ocellatum]
MDLKVEAQRVMAVALGKMYNSRLQRGGVRLRKSLLLSLVLRSARDIYLSARTEQQQQEAGHAQQTEAGAMEVDVRREEGERGARPGGEESKGAPRPGECIQSRECIQPQPQECIQPQPRECIQSRECIHCGRDNVSDPGHSGSSVCPASCPSQRRLGTAGSPGPEPDRSRKRRKAWEQRDCPDSGCLPVKRARLEDGESRRPAESTSSLVCALGSGFSGIPGEQPVSPGHICRDRALSELGSWPRAIVAY